MLLAINDKIKGWLGIAVVILITLPFALWGIGEYFSDAGPRYAAKVNGSEISLNEYDRSVSIQRRNLLEQNDGQLPISDKELRERTLTQLVNTRLLEAASYDYGYRISDNVLGSQLRQIFTVDGVFDRSRLEMALAQLGMSSAMYEQTLRNELRVQQLQSTIGNTVFVTDYELERLAALSAQRRDFHVVTFNIDVFSGAVEPTQEEIKAYYDANASSFMTPEKIKVDYVEITHDMVADSVDVDETELRRMYDDYLASLQNRQERKASHILVTTAEDNTDAAREKIEQVREKLEAGEDFAALAREYSEDPGSAPDGGDLGWVQPGDMVKPFEDALFDLEAGATSDIVQSQFGFHIIQLTDIRQEQPDDFDIKRYELEAELKNEAVASRFYDLSEQLALLSYENPDSLDVVVEDMELAIQTSDYFTAGAGAGIAENPKVRNISYSDLVLAEGRNSDIIEISPDHVVVVRLNEHIEAKPIPVEEVSSTIKQILIAESGYKQTEKAALAAKQRLENGEPVAALEANGVKIESFSDVRRDETAKVREPQIMNAAFSISSDADAVTVEKVDLYSGDVALVVLDKVSVTSQTDEALKEALRREWAREESVRSFANVLLAIKNGAEIEQNTRLFQSDE